MRGLTKMLKKLLISLGAVTVTMAVTFGALYTMQQFGGPATDEDAQPAIVLDFSKDYQACTSLDEQTISSTLGDVADTLQPAKNTGITEEQPVGEGVENTIADSQTCVYAFKPGGNAENVFNSDNALIIQKTRYTTLVGADEAKAQIELDPTAEKIESLQDDSYYTAVTNANGPDASYAFDLLVFSNTESTSYSIRQPADLASFSAETAKATLIELVNQAGN